MSNGRIGTVLLAEDEPEIRVLLASVLRGSGFQVLEAADGADAIRIAFDHGGDVDLVVTDVCIPVLNGVQVREVIRAVSPEQKFPFISAFPDEALAAGDFLLQKPFLPSVFIQRVRQALAADTASATRHG